MAANLDDAIKKWNTASHKDNRAFQDDIAFLYEGLIEGVGLKLGKIEDFLNGAAGFMDKCVRWHLLKLAIEGAQSSKIDAQFKLAKTIMESEEEEWDLLISRPTGTRLKKACKWKPNGEKSGIAKQKSEQQQNPHFRKNADQKTLFAMALCENHPYMDELLAKMQERYTGQRRLPFEDRFAERVRAPEPDSKIRIHGDLSAAHKKAGSALRHVLRKIPGFLVVSDPLLDEIIEGQFLGLAEAILESKNHYRLLTTRERIVKAIESWLQWQSVLPPANQDNQDRNPKRDEEEDEEEEEDKDDNESYHDYNNDSGGDDNTSRRDLAIRLLSKAPEDVLRSPEVLTVVTRNSLLDDPDILQAYARSTKDAREDSKVSRVPFASFQTVASFLQNVPGILHMAVFYQQRPLVEALLRGNAELVINRAYVETTTAGGTIPVRIRQEAPAETAPAASDAPTGTNGEPPGQDGDSGYYPLWYNNEAKTTEKATRPAQLRHVQDDKDRQDDKKQRLLVWKQIRSALIYCTMKHAENLQTLLTILRDSREPESEINFDMSRLLIEGTSVADFVTSMTRKGKSYNLIRYEETIRYADFPVLDRSTQPQVPAVQNLPRSHLQHAHTEIPEMLDWLDKHGVHRIINLRVPDRMANPHDELEIARAVKRFLVEELDWRILDLSLNIFRPHGALGSIPLVCAINNESAKDDKKTDMRETYLRRLHLYTGGRRSALDHWFSAEGLESMNLDYVCIHVIKELTTKTQSEATLQYINGKSAELEKRKPSMQIDVLSQFWTAQTETPRLQEIIHHLSPRLAQFIAHYRHGASQVHDAHKDFRPAKVAIIDNGILSMDPPSAPRSASSGSTRPEAPADTHSRSKQHLHSQEFLVPDNLWARICDGKSFVNEPNRVSPWYLASNPHGTQMANLVCAIDPLCQLFIAKIADSHYGYSAARAAEAVRWAIEKGVDIISMSFTTIENDSDFTKAVQKAMDAGILIVCSHHDEGARIGTVVYPACLISKGDNNTMLRMASCDMYGKLQHDWNDNASDSSSRNNDQYEFCINSQDVTVGVIPFLASSTERISGSSVATAIAAGVCSLLIACLRTVHQMTSNRDGADGNTERIRFHDRIHANVGNAISNANYRPSYTDIKKYLATMTLSDTNSRFISLDRFARLDELRDVNTSSLQQRLFALGANFPAK